MKTLKYFRLTTALAALLLTADFAVAQPCVPAPSGAVAWWRAEGNAQDSAGTHHGTLQGAASYASGKVGQGFSFDGADGSYVSVPDSTAWDFGVNDFTIELWAKFNDRTKRSMFIHQQSGVNAGGFEFDYQAAGAGLVFARNPSEGFFRPWSPLNDTWYHLALTRQGNTFQLYVNGVPYDAPEVDANPVNNVTGPLRIGSYVGQTGYGHDGLIDEISIYSRALSAAELLAIYNAGSGGKCTDCSANLIFNGSFEIWGVPDGYVAVPSGSSLINGWVTTAGVFNGNVEWFNPWLAHNVQSGMAADGNYLLNLQQDPFGPSGGIVQTFPTVPGRKYKVSFAFGTSREKGRGGSSTIAAKISQAGGVEVHQFGMATTSPTINWERHQFTFTATTTSADLIFTGGLVNGAGYYVSLDDVRVTDCPESLAGFGGFNYSTLGGASAVVSSNQLFISNFGTQGTGGVRFDMSGMHAASLVLGDLDSSTLPDGASITVSAFGELNGNADTLISSLRATRAGSQLEISPNFSSIGAVAYTALVYDGSNLVAQARDLTGVVARVTGSMDGGRWNPYFPNPASAQPWSVVEFPAQEDHFLALPGGQPVRFCVLMIIPQANRITQPINPIVTPTYTIRWPKWVPWYLPGPYVNPPWRDPGDPPPNLVSIGSLTRFEATGQNAGTLRIMDTFASMFGLHHKAVGGASLTGEGTSLYVDNSSLDPAGVEVFVSAIDEWGVGTGTTEFDARWLELTPQPEPPDFSLPVGAFLRATVTGSTNGGTNQILATIQALKSGSNSITILGSFPGFVVAPPAMQVWLGPTIVYSGAGTNPATVGYWPEGVDGVIPPGCPAPGPGCPGPDPTIAFGWASGVPITVAGSNFIGDRIRFVASDPIPHPSIKFDHFGLFTGGGLPGLQIIDEHISQAGQFFSGLSHLPIGLASFTTSSNGFEVTNLGTNGDYGTSVALGNSPFAEVSIIGPDTGAPEGAEVRVKSYGALNGVPERLLGSIIATNVGTNLQFSADITPLDTPLPGSPIPDGPITDVHYLIFDGPIIVAGGPLTNTIRIPNKLRLAWLAGPWQMFRPGAFRSSIELSNRTPVSISGQPSVFGTRVEFQVCWSCGNPSPQPSLRDAPSLSRVDLVAHGLPSFIISRERLGLLAQAHEAAGLARILGVGKELHLRNLVSGSANPDGIDFPFGPDYLTNNFSASWRPFDAWSLMPTGYLRASASGIVTGGVEQVLGSTTITKLGLLKEIFANYGPVFPTSRRVEVVRSNVVVFTTSFQGATGVVGSVDDWPINCGKTTVGPGGPVLCFWWRFWPQAQFLINTQSVSGDEIRILAENTPVSVAHLTQFSLRASGMDEIILTSAAAESPYPSTVKVQRFGNILTTSWNPPNLRQALQSANKVTGPWADVPGVTASPYLVSPIGSNQFLRVIQR